MVRNTLKTYANAPQSFKYYKSIIILALFSVMMPIVFIWITELTMQPKEDIMATNGFWTSEPIKIYHIAMYIMVITALLTALFLIDMLFKAKRNYELN